MKKILIFAFLFITISPVFAIENRDKIVIIDTGISKEQSIEKYICKNGLITTIEDSTVYDEQGHGTNVIGLISKNINPTKQCIISIKAFTINSTTSNYLKALKVATKLKPKFINLSLAGVGILIHELSFIDMNLENGTKIVVASGNEKIDLDYDCKVFPACYKEYIPKIYKKNFYVIGSNTTHGNTGGIVDAYLDGKDKGYPKMSGTSQATAIFTASLIQNN